MRAGKSGKASVLGPVIAVAAAVWLTGCYERVVSSSGIGTSKTVQEPYRSETDLDKAYDRRYGSPEKKFRGADPVE